MYKELISAYHYNRDKLTKIDPLYPKMGPGFLRDCFDRMVENTYFIAEEGGIPADCTYHITVLKLKDILYVYNNEFIVRMVKGDTSHNYQPSEADYRLMFDEITPGNLDLNHYDYLELVIEEFWVRVFGKTLSETWNDGIIVSHGDKAYGYKDTWEKAGIPFNRGVLIFLLTYTRELGETPKHESREWVVRKYNKYLPFIEEAEKLAGLK